MGEDTGWKGKGCEGGEGNGNAPVLPVVLHPS
jgi:hypothetical protein